MRYEAFPGLSGSVFAKELKVAILLYRMCRYFVANCIDHQCLRRAVEVIDTPGEA
jgi:hypothetical protein